MLGETIVPQDRAPFPSALELHNSAPGVPFQKDLPQSQHLQLSGWSEPAGQDQQITEVHASAEEVVLTL